MRLTSDDHAILYRAEVCPAGVNVTVPPCPVIFCADAELANLSLARSRLKNRAHALACLRFAGHVTVTVARLATGSDGLTPGRAGFAPAG